MREGAPNRDIIGMFMNVENTPSEAGKGDIKDEQ